MDGGMGENFQRWSFPSLTPDDVLVEIFDGLHSSYPLLPLLQQVISLSQGQHPTEVEENGPNPTQNVLHPDLRQEPYTTRQPCQFAQKDGSRAHAIQQQAMPGGRTQPACPHLLYSPITDRLSVDLFVECHDQMLMIGCVKRNVR